jgi:hypothetical protein
MVLDAGRSLRAAFGAALSEDDAVDQHAADAGVVREGQVSGAPATSTTNTLNKASAHIRWLVEKAGVNPEGIIVALIVPTAADRDRLVGRLAKEYDAKTMTKSQSRNQVIANGVKFAVTVREPA